MRPRWRWRRRRQGACVSGDDDDDVGDNHEEEDDQRRSTARRTRHDWLPDEDRRVRTASRAARTAILISERAVACPDPRRGRSALKVGTTHESHRCGARARERNTRRRSSSSRSSSNSSGSGSSNSGSSGNSSNRGETRKSRCQNALCWLEFSGPPPPLLPPSPPPCTSTSPPFSLFRSVRARSTEVRGRTRDGGSAETRRRRR